MEGKAGGKEAMRRWREAVRTSGGGRDTAVRGGGDTAVRGGERDTAVRGRPHQGAQAYQALWVGEHLRGGEGGTFASHWGSRGSQPWNFVLKLEAQWGSRAVAYLGGAAAAAARTAAPTTSGRIGRRKAKGGGEEEKAGRMPSPPPSFGPAAAAAAIWTRSGSAPMTRMEQQEPSRRASSSGARSAAASCQSPCRRPGAAWNGRRGGWGAGAGPITLAAGEIARALRPPASASRLGRTLCPPGTPSAPGPPHTPTPARLCFFDVQRRQGWIVLFRCPGHR